MHFVFTKDQILLDVKIFLSLIRGQLFCATGTRFMKLGGTPVSFHVTMEAVSNAAVQYGF